MFNLGSTIASAVAIGVEQNSRQSSTTAALPQQIAVVGAGSSDVTYTTDPRKISTATEAGNIYGYGSTLHLVAQQLFNGADRLRGQTVTFYPVQEPTGGAAATYEIEITGTSTQTAQLILSVGDYRYSVAVPVNATATEINPVLINAINGDLDNPFLAEEVSAAEEGGSEESTKVLLTAKTKGAWINDLVVSLEGQVDGLTIITTDLGTGAGFIDVSAALPLFGTSWQTILINTSTVEDTTTLNEIQNFGESRWDPLIKKPFVSILGNNITDQNSLRTITDSRRSDRINILVSVPGSNSIPVQIATNTAIIAGNTYDNNPANSAEGQILKNISAGSDSVQPQFAERDLNTKSGLSSTEVDSGSVKLSDFVTMFHPSGESDPAYRYVVTIIKLMNVEYPIDQIFKRPDWAGAPLVDDTTVTRQSVGAKSPKDARADVLAVCERLKENGIINDDLTTLNENMLVEISPTNPNRINIILPITLSGNFKQADITIQFQFLVGGV